MSTGEKVTDFKSTPEDQASRWQKELAAAKKSLEAWHAEAERAVKRYRDERDSKAKDERRLNLYSANVQTKMATLYGQTPKVSVRRRFGDFGDDVGRVAGEMLERALNSDIERDDDTYAQALHYCLEDLLIPSFCMARVRYVTEWEQVAEVAALTDPMTGQITAEAVPAHEKKSYECVETDYVPWKDVLWSPCRVWHEVTWVGFKVLMTREKLVEAFGEDIGEKVPLTFNKPDDTDKGKADPWGRAEVWEICDKEKRETVWYVDGFHKVLKTQPDALELGGYWPCPKPIIPFATTSAMVPRAEFELARDLYNTIDLLQKRIDLLSEAVRVAGIHDKSIGDVQRLLEEAGFINLIPAENWPALSEKGGLAGVIDWFPIEPITKAIVSLQAAQDRAIEQVFQVTGMADIMRGASDPSETARAQGIKAKFGSVRLQRLQDEFARFASDIQRLKAEIISKHFDAETIIKVSNIEFTPDAQLAQQAVQLIKDKFNHYRIEVKPEAISLTDFAALKQERTEVVAAISQYMTAIAPLGQTSPQMTPGLLQILQWLISGLRGSAQIEGVIDQMVELAKQAAAQPKPQAPPDPKVIAQQMKGQQDMQKVQAELQADLMRTQAEVQADSEREQNQATWNVKEHAQKALITAQLRPTNPPSPNGRGFP